MNQIFGLLDPRTSQIKYIGQTRRAGRHPREYFWPSFYLKRKLRVAIWIKELIETGHMPQVIVLEEVPDQAALDEAERFYIFYFRWLGADLCNRAEGGLLNTGIKFTSDEISSMTKHNIGKKYGPISEERRRKISLAKMGKPSTFKGRKHSEESIRKIRLARIKNSIEVTLT